MAENETFKLIEQAIELVQKKKMNELADNNIKNKTANVITYDKESCTATISLVEDRNNNEYRVYNKSGEDLSEGDVVKVFYTTNVAKGWIETRMGRPVVEETPPQYISQLINNTTDSELGVNPETVFEVDFDVVGTDSHIVFNANQIIDVKSIGTTTEPKSSGSFECKYYVDSELQDFKPKQPLLVGGNTFTHVLPMKLKKGLHKLVVKMSSSDAKGNTFANNMIGALSGQISKIDIIEPLNEKMVYILEVAEDNTTINMPPPVSVNNGDSSHYYGNIDWGDGDSLTDADLCVVQEHTYTSAGRYKISIQCNVVNWSGVQAWQTDYTTWKDSIRKIILPYNALYWSPPFVKDSKLENIDFGQKLIQLSYALEKAPLSGTNIISLSFPESLTNIMSKNYFSGTKITTVTIPKTWAAGYPMTDDLFTDCNELVKVITYCPNIGYGWFYNCDLLTNINLYNTESIGNGTFHRCISLKSVTIPKTVTKIGESAFRRCFSLSEVIFESGGTDTLTIDSLAFFDTKLTSVSLPRRAEGHLGLNAFPVGCEITYYD